MPRLSTVGISGLQAGEDVNREQARQAGRKLLGDRIEAVLKATGIQKTVQAIERRTGWDCGCGRRTAAINRWDAKRH